MEYQYWNDLKMGKPQFNPQTKKFSIDLIGRPIKTPPLQVIDSDGDTTTFRMNPSFPGFYLELMDLYNTIVKQLHQRRKEIFQLDIPHQRIDRLVVRHINLPKSLHELPTISLATNQELSPDQSYQMELEFTHLILSPTDIKLDLHIQQIKEGESTFDPQTESIESDQESSVNDSEYDY